MKGHAFFKWILIDRKEFYDVSAIFHPCNGGKVTLYIQEVDIHTSGCHRAELDYSTRNCNR